MNVGGNFAPLDASDNLFRCHNGPGTGFHHLQFHCKSGWTVEADWIMRPSVNYLKTGYQDWFPKFTWPQKSTVVEIPGARQGVHSKSTAAGTSQGGCPLRILGAPSVEKSPPPVTTSLIKSISRQVALFWLRYTQLAQSQKLPLGAIPAARKMRSHEVVVMVLLVLAGVATCDQTVDQTIINGCAADITMVCKTVNSAFPAATLAPEQTKTFTVTSTLEDPTLTCTFTSEGVEQLKSPRLCEIWNLLQSGFSDFPMMSCTGGCTWKAMADGIYWAAPGGAFKLFTLWDAPGTAPGN